MNNNAHTASRNDNPPITRNSWLARSLSVIMAVAAAPALADSVPGTVTEVEYVSGTASWQPALVVRINGTTTSYWAQQPAPGCGMPQIPVDTVKAWQALATSALLSGKPVLIWYGVCNDGNRYIQSIVLKSS